MRRNNTVRRQTPSSVRRNYMYMHTSAAPVFTDDDYSVERPRKKKRIKPDSNYDYVRVEEERSAKLSGLILPFSALAFFALCALTVNARISAVKAEIREAQGITQRAKTVNESLEMILSENTDLEEVKKIATTRLGMQAAAPHQIVKISVEKDSYTVNYDDKVADEKNRTFLERIGITGKDK